MHVRSSVEWHFLGALCIQCMCYLVAPSVAPQVERCSHPKRKLKPVILN